jgi:hypothetical protein
VHFPNFRPPKGRLQRYPSVAENTDAPQLAHVEVVISQFFDGQSVMGSHFSP